MAKRVRINQTVSAVGWAWLVIGVLISLFIGGAIKTLLSDAQISRWLVAQIESQNPPFRLSFESTKMILADGWKPQFGIKISGIAVIPVDECRFRAKIRVGSLFVPLSLHANFKQLFSMGVLQGQNVSVELLEPCGQTQSFAKPKIVPANEVPAAPTATQNYFSQRWKTDIEKSREWLSGIEFHDLEVKGLRPPFDSLKLARLFVEIAKGEAQVNLLTNIKLNSLLKDSETDESFEIDGLVSSDQVKLNSVLPVHEGKISLDANLAFASNLAEIAVQFDFVPTFVVVDLIKSFSRVSDPLDLRRSWLSGNAQIKFKNALNTPDVEVSVKDAAIKGDSGEIKTEDLHFVKLNGEWSWAPFDVFFKELSFQYLLEATGRKGYTGVITNFGTLDGKLHVLETKELDFLGEWKNFDLAFSRRSQRVNQKFESMTGHLEFKKDRMVGLVNNIKVRDGHADGFASFNLDRRALDGLFQIRIERLEFAPEVQKLMVGGQMNSIALFGQGTMQQGQVRTWSGEVGTQRLEGENWMLSGLKIKSEFANEMMSLSVRIKSADFAADHWLAEKLRLPLLGNHEGAPEALSFQLVSVKLDVEKEKGHWKNGLASLSKGGVIAGTSGEWSGGEVTGHLTIDREHSKSNKWSLSGPWNDFTIF